MGKDPREAVEFARKIVMKVENKIEVES